MLNDEDDLLYDTNRIEMSWSDKIETRLNFISEESQSRSKKHAKQSTYNKHLYYITSTTSIIIPFMITFINAINELTPHRQNYELLNISLVMVSGVVNALTTFMSFGKKEAEHKIASIRYDELVIEVESVLILKRRYRSPADTTLRQFTTTLESLNKYSI